VELLKAILKIYEEITPEIAKPIIINDKWLTDISYRISKEMNSTTHIIQCEISALVERYENTLDSLQNTYIEKENAVLNHLKAMGFEL
jgi:type I restriction enzyme M protein